MFFAGRKKKRADLTTEVQKDNISINGVLPGIVATEIIPPEMIAAVSPEW